MADPMTTGHRGWTPSDAIGAGYLLLTLAAEWAALPHGSAGVPVLPWNAAPAFAFALAARLGERWLPLIFVASLLAGLVEGGLRHGTAGILIQASAETLAAAVAAALLRSRRARPDLERLRGVFALFAASTAFSAVAASAEGTIALWSGTDPWKSADIAGQVFLAHLVALLAIAPLFIGFPFPGRGPKDAVLPSVESLLQAMALAVIAWEVFGRFANQELHFFYLLFLPFTWIATRHGQPGSASALAAIYLAPMVTDRLFGHHDQSIIELQIRLAVLAVTSLLLGALASERKLSGERLLARQAEITHFQRLNVGWEMASALAHELNQPLTAAMNYTQAALRLIMAPEPDMQAVGRIMAKSVDQIERVGQTIHGLRDFMRKGELRLTVNGVGDAAEEAIRLVLAEANAAGIALRPVGLSALPPVMADKTQIVQVLVNLIRNAIQSLAAAGTRNAVVTVSGKAVDDSVEVDVADNGPGLHPSVEARLFEPFVTTKEAGMGLGLSISKSILEAHEGRLWGENAPHGGAVFHFTLPKATKGTPDA